MRFFVPNTPDPDGRDRKWLLLRDYCRSLGYAAKDRKLFRLVYKQHGVRAEAEVGKDVLTEFGLEQVLAIFEARPFLICTVKRGLLQGRPLVIQPQAVVLAEEFETLARTAAAGRSPSPFP